MKLVEFYIKYVTVKYGLIEYKCSCSNKNYQQNFGKELNERFFNIYKFSNHETRSLFYCCKKVFILMNIWIIGKNSVKHGYLKKKFYSHLHMEIITDTDYVHSKRVCKNFEIKDLENIITCVCKAIHYC